MEAVEDIRALGEGFEKFFLVEGLGGAEGGVVAGEGVEVGEDLVHAALLGLEGSLHLFPGETVDAEPDPIGHLGGAGEGLGVAGELVGIEEPGHDLVERVPRGPDALAGFHAVDEGFGKGREVAGMGAGFGQGGLAFGKAGHDGIGALLEPVIAGGGVHEGAGGEIMADDMAAQFAIRGFPAAVGFGGDGEAGVDAEVQQQAVRVQTQEILLVAPHGVPERTVEQADIRERERLG